MQVHRHYLELTDMLNPLTQALLSFWALRRFSKGRSSPSKTNLCSHGLTEHGLRNAVTAMQPVLNLFVSSGYHGQVIPLCGCAAWSRAVAP